MIRHSPGGRGHAYLVERDQRVPTQPAAGQPLELRATTGDGVAQLWLELERDGRSERIEASHMEAVAEDARRPADHAPQRRRRRRSAAEARVEGRARGPRSGRAPALPVHGHRRLSTRAGIRQSSRSGWPTEARSTAALTATGSSWTAYAGSRTTSAVHRVRFALRLRPDERVVGFGERFDALDQRGSALDAVVFEQYKGQGADADLPADAVRDVVGGDGWGFHVETSRRVLVRRRRTDDEPASGRSRARAASRRLTLAALRTAARPRCSTRSSTRVGAAGVASRLGLPSSWCSGNEWNTQATRAADEVRRGATGGIPVGVARDRGVERRDRRSRRSATPATTCTPTAARTGSPTSRSHATAPGPTRRAWSTSCTTEGSGCSSGRSR